MTNTRRTATLVGLLFIIGTSAGVSSVAFSDPIFNAADPLAAIAASPNQLIIAALCVLAMGLSLVMIPPLMFPIFRKHNEPLAMGFVVYRSVLEPASYLITVVAWLMLITLSREAAAGAANAATLQTIGVLLDSASEWGSHITTLAFGMGALIMYTMFYQTRLIPRWLSIWGLIAIVMHIIAGMLALFGVVEAFSTAQWILNIPIALQEMVMAVFLIVRGFSNSALDAESVGRLRPA